MNNEAKKITNKTEAELLYWFVITVQALNQIKVVPIDYDRANAIHKVVTSYRIYITLCCKRVSTLCGTGATGTDKLYYDATISQTLCNNNNKITHVHGFNCTETPVLKVDIEGLDLVYSNEKRYGHCPSCGGLYIRSKRNWLVCDSCNAKDMTTKKFYTCAHCKVRLKNPTTKILTRFNDNTCGEVYLCKKHHKYGANCARYKSWQEMSKFLTKMDLKYSKINWK